MVARPLDQLQPLGRLDDRRVDRHVTHQKHIRIGDLLVKWTGRLVVFDNKSFSEQRAEAVALIQPGRSEEHTSELQSLMRISYAVFCLKKKTKHISRTSQTSP